MKDKRCLHATFYYSHMGLMFTNVTSAQFAVKFSPTVGYCSYRSKRLTGWILHSTRCFLNQTYSTWLSEDELSQAKDGTWHLATESISLSPGHDFVCVFQILMKWGRKGVSKRKVKTKKQKNDIHCTPCSNWSMLTSATLGKRAYDVTSDTASFWPQQD
jgi:hypothetical protein